MAASAMPHHIGASVNYFDSVKYGPGSGFVWYPRAVSEKRRSHDARNVTVTNVRGIEEKFSIDNQGFQYLTAPSFENEFDDSESWKDEYYREGEGILKSLLGASAVKAVSHVLRKHSNDEAKESEKDQDGMAPTTKLATARFVHVDQSDHGANIVLDGRLSPEEAAKVRANRWAIVNIWRPFKRTVTREPLAVCDARTVDSEDLHPMPGHFSLPGEQDSMKSAKIITSTGGNIESLFVTANDKKHKWYYRSNMEPGEILLIKQYDSKTKGVARRAPHTAFVSPDDHGPARQSIETRFIVCWDDQPTE